MKRLSLFIAIVILFVASSCAPSYMCPTYTSIDSDIDLPQESEINNL